MVGHPGDDEAEIAFLARKMKQLQNVEQFQLFTPTPMTDSTCMYWAGMNPYTLQPVKVVYDFVTKKKMRDMVLKVVGEKNK
ncbi:DUF3362 domain-containing protein [Candidatus Woesearchaeota archaeon]|nr:DUF3362 domain-containing protein [Candidatus Woesearchaeota archaeon]